MGGFGIRWLKNQTWSKKTKQNKTKKKPQNKDLIKASEKKKKTRQKNQTWSLTLWSLSSNAGGMGWISKWKEDYRTPGCGKAMMEEKSVMRKNRKHSFKLVYSKKKDYWESKRGTEENTSRKKQQVWKPGGRKNAVCLERPGWLEQWMRNAEELRVH